MENNLNTPQENKIVETAQSSSAVVNVAKSKKPLVIFIIIILWAGSLAGVYLITKSNKTSNSSSTNDTNNSSQPTNQSAAEAEKTTKFDYKKNGIPFTFDYPSDWSFTTDDFSDGSQVTDQNDYHFTFYAPGTIETETGIGGPLITKGSSITIYVNNVTKTADQIINDYKSHSMVAGLEKITISGLDAVRLYPFSEGPGGVTTVIISKNKLYRFTYNSDSVYGKKYEGSAQTYFDAEVKSEHYKSYEALLNSLAF